MNLKTFKSTFRKKMKEENRKIVLGREENKITLYPVAGKSGKLCSTGYLAEEDSTLYITSIQDEYQEKEFESVYIIISYWLGYAKAEGAKNLAISKSILSQRSSWRFAHKIKEEKIEFISALGFKDVKEDDEEKFVLEISKFKEILPIDKKIQEIFSEKMQKDITLKLEEKNLEGKGVIFKRKIDWFGHKDVLNISYDYDAQLYKIYDKKVTIESKEEELEEKIDEYFSRIEKLRKIKNIYDPPTANLESFLSKNSYSYGSTVDAKALMGAFIEKGYLYSQIEEEAVRLISSEEFQSKGLVNIGVFSGEQIFKFLNHYVFVYPKGKVTKVFDTKEELIAYYEDMAIQKIKERITDKKPLLV